MMQQCGVSERRWLLVLLRPGYHSGTVTSVVSPACCACLAFIYKTGESKKAIWSEPTIESKTELSCCGSLGATILSQLTR